MELIEVADVAARVSEQISATFCSHQKVSRMVDNATVEIIHSPNPVGLNDFWPNDCQLSDDRKRFLFWQYHRSLGCDQIVYILVRVLKELCDSGIVLAHQGKKVVDILVLNSMEYDVSDLIEPETDTPPLAIRDPVSGVVTLAIATHAVMDAMTEIGEAGCLRLGRTAPGASKSRSKIKELRPDAYSTSVPHWWLAVVVEGQGEDEQNERSMVHIDLCGAAYNENALVSAPSNTSLVPLQIFCTPEYAMIPNQNVELDHKLILLASVKEDNPNPRVTLQPESIRHFRVYHEEGRYPLEVTPLETFLERKDIHEDCYYTEESIDCIIENIRNNVMIRVPAGLNVIVCNIKSQPELNDCSGRVHNSAEKIKALTSRIPVQISGKKLPVRLKPSCIRLPFDTRPYRSLEVLQQEHSNIPSLYMEPLHSYSKDEVQAALSNPAVVKVQNMLMKGQFTFSDYADPEFKKGIKMFLSPPLDEVFPPEMQTAFINGLELSDHPKAENAMKIINMMKACKQRALNENKDITRGDGGISLEPLSSMYRMQQSVIHNIQRDAKLRFVFERLDELGWFVNPTKSLSNSMFTA